MSNMSCLSFSISFSISIVSMSCIFISLFVHLELFFLPFESRVFVVFVDEIEGADGFVLMGELV